MAKKKAARKAPRSAGTQAYIATLSDSAMSAAARKQVMARLKKSGFRVAEELPELGLVRGTAAPSKAGMIRRIQGVSAIEPEETIQLPPPDSPVQ